MSTLLGWWKGEDNTNDSVGTNNAGWGGTDPTYGIGVVGKCFRVTDFDPGEENTWVGGKIPDIYDFKDDGAFSFEFYFKCDEELILYNNWLFVGDGWGLKIDNSYPVTGYHLQLQTGWDSPAGTQQYDNCFTPDTWSKIKISYNNQRWDLYVNDILLTPPAYYDYHYMPGNFIEGFGFCVIHSQSHELEKYISIDELKIYDDSGLGKKTIRFTDASKGGPLTHDLDFGDGSAHATSLPVDHEYDLDAIGSPYTVDATLTVTGSKGQTDSITKTIDLAGA